MLYRVITLYFGMILLQCLLPLLAHKVANYRYSRLHFTMSHQTELHQDTSSRNYDTIVTVHSHHQHRCTTQCNPGISLNDYMQLPVEQYVCIKMPLDAHLERVDTSRFVLTIPPVNFFHLKVSPSAYCTVTQNNTAVIIESDTCILDGSPYVKSLNGCFRFKLVTVFEWHDDHDHKHISSTSNLLVEVDPPSPFSRIARPVLRRTGHIAMSTAISYIEKEFVKSLSVDFANWATDPNYRATRAFCSADPMNTEVAPAVQ